MNTSELSGQMAELFCIDPVEMDIEIVTLKNNVQLKSQQHSQHFWSLLDPDNYKNLHQAALKMSALFGSTYLCESAFSDMNIIKSKFRTRLTDDHLNDSIRVNLSCWLYEVLIISVTKKDCVHHTTMHVNTLVKCNTVTWADTTK